MIFFRPGIGFLLKYPADECNDDRSDDTEQDHGGDGKVKTEVGSFNPDIARQLTYPVQFVMEKIYDQANNDYCQTRK